MGRREDLQLAQKELSRRYLGLKRGGVRARPGSSLRVKGVVALSRWNVHAVGIGRKIVAGKESKELCIRLHVRQKLPKTMISAQAKLPPSLYGIPTDVIESRIPTLLASSRDCAERQKSACRPVVGGISAAHKLVLSGTIGCICASTDEADDPNARFLLSNNHVLAALELGRPNDAILQPAPKDGGMSGQRVAGLHRSVELFVAGERANRVDAAIARLDPNVAFQPEVCGIGSILGVEAGERSMPVRKQGRSTGYTEGVITEAREDALVQLDESDPSLLALFEHQYRIEPTAQFPAFADHGDSGSLIVHRTRRQAIGLLFAASPGHALANPIGEVLELLRIAIV